MRHNAKKNAKLLADLLLFEYIDEMKRDGVGKRIPRGLFYKNFFNIKGGV